MTQAANQLHLWAFEGLNIHPFIEVLQEDVCCNTSEQLTGLRMLLLCNAMCKIQGASLTLLIKEVGLCDQTNILAHYLL